MDGDHRTGLEYADHVNGVVEQDWNKLESHRQNWKIG